MPNLSMHSLMDWMLCQEQGGSRVETFRSGGKKDTSLYRSMTIGLFWLDRISGVACMTTYLKFDDVTGPEVIYGRGLRITVYWNDVLYWCLHQILMFSLILRDFLWTRFQSLWCNCNAFCWELPPLAKFCILLNVNGERQKRVRLRAIWV